MAIGSIITANDINRGSGDAELIFRGITNVFPVLSIPSYISFSVGFSLSGADLTKNNLLRITIESQDSREEITIFENNIPANSLIGSPEESDSMSLGGNMNMRNVVITNIGLHDVKLKLNEELITQTPIRIVINENVQ
ncbi:Uncharacterised protein [Listeria grayi]|uniref:Uncharacterized protein n=1 Tax=Listeria grayi TaxID=1641 RepID=A0A378MJD1_LISGR|nr:hypothetical protein [Listeria grayi]STY45522.1 Uncharacterised protein [Listeria grayi]